MGTTADNCPLRLRIYSITSWLLRRGLVVTRAVFDGAWLGVLDYEATHALDETYYDEARQYTDEAYNRSGLLSWEREAVDRFFADRCRIVVTGAGGGREVLALLELGYDAVGYEPNEGLVRFGEDLLASTCRPGRLRPADRDTWPRDADACDGVIVGWGSYMLIRGRERRVAFLRGARSGLQAGAPLLLSFFPRSGKPGYLRVVARVGNAIRRLRGATPLDFGDALDPNYVHYFDRREIDSELGEAGFSLAWYDASGYGKAVGLAAGDGDGDGDGASA